MKTSYIILTLLLATSLEAQWSTDPNSNLIIGYGLDPHICSDSAGGCYVTYDYGTTSYPRKLALERLDKYGYKPWGTKKQIIGELPEQWQAEIIEDGEGGVIVGYEDNEWIPPYYFKSRVRVQKVDSSGNFLWEQAGVQATVVDTNHGLINLVSDGEGGCVILWQDYDGNYYLNRLNSLGQRVWGDSGIFIGTGNYSRSEIINATDGNYYVETGEYIYRIKQNGEFTLWNSSNEWWLIVAAPDGGGILHSAIWSPSYYTLLAQRKDTLSNNLWQEPYVEIADSLDINTNLEVKYNNGYYYYGWYGIKNGVEKVAQFQALRLDGSKLFQDGSIQIGTPPINGSHVVPLEENRTAFIYANKDFLPDSLLAQSYDSLGNKLWNENGIVISHPKIAYKSYTTDGNGGFIVGGVIDNFTVVAQQVSKYGNLGEIVTSAAQETTDIIPLGATLYQNFPNPFNSFTVIRYFIPSEGQVTIGLYNVIGELINTIVDSYHSTGIHTVNLSSNDLPSGIYLYKLKTGIQSLTKKLIIIK